MIKFSADRRNSRGWSMGWGRSLFNVTLWSTFDRRYRSLSWTLLQSVSHYDA